MTYIKDLIDLPDRFTKAISFETELTASPVRKRRSPNYVVTTQLVKCFDSALGLIRSALEGRVSEAASAWQFRQRQEPLYGDPPSDIGRRCARALDSRTGAGHCQTQRVNEGERISAGAVSYGRCAGYGIGAAGWLRRNTSYINPFPKRPCLLSLNLSKIFDDARKLREKMGDQVFFANLKWRTDAGRMCGWGEMSGGW